ncbi:unnamed protein product, partial [Discosporangium mesarthrocarpum]
MDRRIQSALDKRSRMGSWQTRVFRLERGFLSYWSTVADAAANRLPCQTLSLYQDGEVSMVTDQGDRKFQVSFPWDGGKALMLRASSMHMKDMWVECLKAATAEALSQIQGTGEVYNLGGRAKYKVDEAYDEAAHLRTNRFLAAYVVDEEHRAAYLNDQLNEKFWGHSGHWEGCGKMGGRAVESRVFQGARAAMAEFLALLRDHGTEMQGVEELYQEAGSRVSATKIRAFCDEHLVLSGRLVVTRL